MIDGRPHLAKLISGGQTGVDRAALDVAMALGLACGGWVPRGRRAEDGRVPPVYPMREAPSSAYAERTRLNVRDADATLILTRGEPVGGTALTIAAARRLRRPVLIVDLEAAAGPAGARKWLNRHQVRVLNVAGPRESGAPGIYAEACVFLRRLLNPAGEDDP